MLHRKKTEDVSTSEEHKGGGPVDSAISTGQPVPSPTHPHCQCTGSTKPAFRHSQRSREHDHSACKYVAPPQPSWGNPAMSPDPGWHPGRSTSSGVSWLTNIGAHLPGHTPELMRSRFPIAAGRPEDMCDSESHQVIAGKRK